MLLLIFSGSAATPEPPDTSTDQFGPYAFFVDRVTGQTILDIPRDDDEVLLMVMQFIASRQVH